MRSLNLTTNFIYCLVIILTSCTVTTTRSKQVDLNDGDSLIQTLRNSVLAEHLSLIGKESKTGNQSQARLDVKITNCQNIPQEEDLAKLFSKAIAMKIKSHLKDSTDFDFYAIMFVTEKKDGVITKTNSRTYTFTSAAVNAPILSIGKKLSNNGWAYGGTVFTADDSDILVVLDDFTFVDTSAIAIRLYKRDNGQEEKLAGSRVTANPYDDRLTHSVDVHEFYKEYGTGKFNIKIWTHDTLIAEKDFELK